jgi:transcriptional regulator
LRPIVGIEVSVERVEAKAKFSQNRSAEDREGVVRGLQQERSQRATWVAEQMATSIPGGPPGSTG